MKLSSPCTRWQHLLQTILTEESLSPQEQADLHAHLAECPACAQLNEQRLTLLSTLRAQATVAPPEKASARSVHSMERMFAQLQPSSKQNAPILSLRSKGRQTRRFLSILKLMGGCAFVLFAWGLLLAALDTLLINLSIHQPLSGTLAEQEALIQKAINANAVSLNVLCIVACAGAAVSLGLLLGKHFSAQPMRGSQRRSREGNLTIVFPSEKGQATPQTLYLESLDGKHIRRFARVLASQTGQLQASFRLIPAGRYILRTSPPAGKFLVSVPQGQTVTIELNKKEEPPVVHIIVLDTKDEQLPTPYIIKGERKEEQSPAPQRSSCPDQHPERWRHLTRDIKV